MSEYAKRDHAALGAHYVRHISAMTAEALHTKSAIAGELAWRDAEIERLRREHDELRRWKSTNAPRLDALEGLLHAAQSDAAAGREAIATLDSERAANAILTSEVELLADRLAEIERAEPVAWIEHELQGTGLRHLHFERRPNALRDDVVAPAWTALIARPAPAAAPELEPTGWKVVPVDPTPGMVDAADSVNWCDGDTRGSAINMWHLMLAAAPERAEPTGGCGACGDACRQRGSCRLADESPRPAASPDDVPRRCAECDLLGGHKLGCPDRVSCPKGGAA